MNDSEFTLEKPEILTVLGEPVVKMSDLEMFTFQALKIIGNYTEQSCLTLVADKTFGFLLTELKNASTGSVEDINVKNELDAILEALSEIKDKRNFLIHSWWYMPHGFPAMAVKYSKSKDGKLLRDSRQEVTVEEVAELLTKIDQSKDTLVRFLLTNYPFRTLPA